MAETVPQTFANHSKFDPWYHFFLFPVFAVQALILAWGIVQNPSPGALWSFVVAAAMIVFLLKLRLYPMRVQDRVIRLEERLRLTILLPEALKSRIGELTESQLIALRFASDAEIPALVEKTLANKLPNREIKKLITNWRPDYFRV